MPFVIDEGKVKSWQLAHTGTTISNSNMLGGRVHDGESSCGVVSLAEIMAVSAQVIC